MTIRGDAYELFYTNDRWYKVPETVPSCKKMYDVPLRRVIYIGPEDVFTDIFLCAVIVFDFNEIMWNDKFIVANKGPIRAIYKSGKIMVMTIDEPQQLITRSKLYNYVSKNSFTSADYLLFGDAMIPRLTPMHAYERKGFDISDEVWDEQLSGNYISLQHVLHKYHKTTLPVLFSTGPKHTMLCDIILETGGR